MKQLLWVAVIVLVFVLSWVAGGLLQQQDEHNFSPMRVSPCQLVATACNAEFADAHLQLTFASPVVVMSPFVASVSTPANISEMFLQFRMRDMEMGVQRYRMLKNADGVWQSAVTLPVCVMGRSDWVAMLEVRYMETWWRGEFDFTALSAL